MSTYCVTEDKHPECVTLSDHVAMSYTNHDPFWLRTVDSTSLIARLAHQHAVCASPLGAEKKGTCQCLHCGSPLLAQATLMSPAPSFGKRQSLLRSSSANESSLSLRDWREYHAMLVEDGNTSPITAVAAVRRMPALQGRHPDREYTIIKEAIIAVARDAILSVCVH